MSLRKQSIRIWEQCIDFILTVLDEVGDFDAKFSKEITCFGSEPSWCDMKHLNMQV